MSTIGTTKNLLSFVLESNFIENIRDPARAERECPMYEQLLAQDKLDVECVCDFAAEVTEGAGRLREKAGMDVTVMGFRPPPGGPHIKADLADLLERVNSYRSAWADGGIDPWTAHCQFETLHPFIDGNGRTGRVIWLWQKTHRGSYGTRDVPPSFLKQFYFQTLDKSRELDLATGIKCGVCGGRRGTWKLVARKRQWVECPPCNGTGQQPVGKEAVAK